MFAAVKAGHLVPSVNFKDSDVPLYEGLIVPQAWTLGVALSFYLIAPFVLPRRRWIWGLLLASLLLRAYLVHVGFGARDPWAYGFFPTELALFLCGSLAHQIFLPVYERKLGDRAGAAAIAATIFLLAVSFAYPWLPGGLQLRSLALLACFLLLVPLTFMFQNRYALDRKIGELSYPIYVCHMLVVSVAAPLIEVRYKGDAVLRSAVMVALTVVLAVALNACIAVPFEKVRLRLKLSNARPSLPEVSDVQLVR
jgi:peptidoglycan/LPS O-acetylase OafA/YrhL